MWLKSKRVSFDFLPGRGRRDPHIDVQGTFHRNEQWLAFKEYEKNKFSIIIPPPHHPAEAASDSVRGWDAKAAPNGFRPQVVFRSGQF